MNRNILIISAIVALVTTFFALAAVRKNTYKYLRELVIILLAFTAFRYVTLIVYSDTPSNEWLQILRYFYFASSIGITIPTALAVWYVTPGYREEVAPLRFTAFFIPWIIFYLYVIIKQPTAIVKGSRFGYELILTGQFPLYLSIAQGSFVSIIVVLCLIGIIKFKHLQIRVQLIMIIIAQLVLTVDGITFNAVRLTIFPRFTISEALALGAIYYAYKIPIKSIKHTKALN